MYILGFDWLKSHLKYKKDSLSSGIDRKKYDFERPTIHTIINFSKLRFRLSETNIKLHRRE